MSSPALEAFLARIYVDAEARERFLDDPRGEAAHAGLSEADCAALAHIDREGLALAAESFARKRRQAATSGWRERLAALFRRTRSVSVRPIRRPD